MHFRTLLAAAATAVVGGLVSSACGLNQEGVPPLRDAIAFPGAALIDPAGRWLYVANSNSDLRYNDGTLVAVDLTHIDPVRRQQTGRTWDLCPEVGYVHHHSDPDAQFCCWDLLDRTILNCDERDFIPSGSTVRIGSFASALTWQTPLCAESAPPSTMRPCANAACTHADPGNPGTPALNDGRLYINVRGNSSVTYVDVARPDDGGPVRFSCGGSTLDFPECDKAHQINHVDDTSIVSMGTDDGVFLPDEPYAMAIDEVRQLLYVGHLRGDTTRPGSGGISLFDVSQSVPAYVGPFGSIFPSDALGLFGVTSLNKHDLRGGDNGQVFVTSRYLPRVGSIIPTNVFGSCTVTQAAVLSTGDAFDTTLGGAEVRGIQFVDDAQRAWVLQRVPPALIGFDLGLDPAGAGRFSPSEVLETCSSPTFLQAHDAGGAGARLFVTCFETGQVYVVDPYLGRITGTIDVGRGPAGLVFGAGPGQDPATDGAVGTRAYVVGFGDNNVSVVDLEPGSPTEYHVIMRLGFPSTVPR